MTLYYTYLDDKQRLRIRTGVTELDFREDGDLPTVDLEVLETPADGCCTITLTGDVTGTGTESIITTISVDAVDIPMLSATGTADGTTFLRGDNVWATPAGSGDMVLASVQTNSGIKTFLDTTLALRNVANTFDGVFTNTNTADRVYTLQDGAGTLAFTSDITGTNSGTNTGDQTITLTGDVTGTGTGSFSTTISVDAVDIPMLSATGTADGTTFLRGDNTWSVPAGGAGDMVLADAQTNSGIKTFLDTTMKLRNVANTFDGVFTNTNTADRVYTLQDGAGTLAFTSDITGTNSGTNTGDQTITLTGDVTGTGTGSFSTTISVDAVDIPMLSATGTADGTTFLRGDNTWSVPAGAGDMVLADAQTNTGIKTFLDTTMKLRNVANTFDGVFTNTNTADRVYTLQDGAGTLAFISDITGTNSGTNTGDQTITLTGDVTGTGTGSFSTTISVDAVDIPMLSATGTADGTTFLRGDNTWSIPAGAGDMVLASAQTNTGIKTFLDTTMKLRNVANTFDGYFVNTNTADRVYTLQDGAGTLAFISDITGTNSGTNTGDQTITLTGDVTGTGTGSFSTTISVDAVDIPMLSATGTADGTTYLRGDNTWGVPPGDGSHTHPASDIVSGTLLHERGGLEADVSTYNGIILIQGGVTSNIRYILNSAVSPTVNDDLGQGWVVGSLWINTTLDTIYMCVDTTTSNAIWHQLDKVETKSFGVMVSDETTALTTGNSKITFRMPYALTLTEVRASVTTAPTGSVITVDINESASTVLSTKLTIDATEKTSTTAIAPAVISDSIIGNDAEITIDIDTVGSSVAGTGLKIWFIGY